MGIGNAEKEDIPEILSSLVWNTREDEPSMSRHFFTLDIKI